MNKTLLASSLLLSLTVSLQAGNDFGNIDGDARMVHLVDSTGADNGAEASATGMSLFTKYTSPEIYQTSFTLGARAVSQVYENSAEGSITSLGLVNIQENKEKDILALALANISYKTDDLTIRIGNQTLESPNVSADDVRLMPNYFQALYLEYWPLDSVMIAAAHVTAMMGWESAASNPYQFSSMSKAAFGEDANKANLSYLTTGYYNKEHNLNADIWYYDLPSFSIGTQKEFMKGAITELNKESTFNTINLTSGAQYFTLSSQAGYYNITGLQVSSQINDVTFQLDANFVDGTQRVVHFWGGVPEFCAMQEYDLGAFSDNGNIQSAYKTAINLDLSPGSSFQIARAHYGGEDSDAVSVKAVDITDVVMSFTRSGLDFIMLYEHLNYTKSSTTTQEALDSSIVRIAMTYQF
jgi:hypothetical protein